MTPEQVRKNLREIHEQWGRIDAGEQNDLQKIASETMHRTCVSVVGHMILKAIAEDRCTHPQTCARELVAHMEEIMREDEKQASER